MARTAGERSWLFVGGLALLAALQPLGCDTGGVGDDVDDTDGADDVVARVLADVGPRVVLPTLRAFAAEAAALEAAVAVWAAVVADGGDDAVTRAEAQAAWRAAADLWQEAEVMQLGPAGDSLSTVGGADLRDRIYSWPTVNRCAVDQRTATRAWEAQDFFATALVNVQGLDALEVLLFSPDARNSCPGQVDINMNGTWDALGADGVARNRAAYAGALATEVRRVADDLVARWAPEGGDFAGAVARPGRDGSPYATEQDALDAVYRALFYVETGTKDRKLARPLGLRDCQGPACAEEAEHKLAEASVDAVVANLRGFRALFTGGDGTGFDDLLRDVGHGDVADTLLAALDAAEAAAAAVEVPVHRAASEDRADAVALHDAVKGVTDVVKGDLATVLALRIPSEASGDND